MKFGNYFFSTTKICDRDSMENKKDRVYHITDSTTRKNKFLEGALPVSYP
jgi:hypothetical protein